MADINLNIIITSDLDGLYSPIKMQRLPDWINNTRFKYMLSIKDIVKIKK